MNGVGQTVDGAGDAVNGVVGGVTGVVNGVTAPILDPITGGAPAVNATVDLHLTGTGTPGATVSAQVAGAVYTTIVASNGGWSITINGLPQSTTGADATISQRAGLLNGLLGCAALAAQGQRQHPRPAPQSAELIRFRFERAGILFRAFAS